MPNKKSNSKKKSLHVNSKINPVMTVFRFILRLITSLDFAGVRFFA